MSNNQLGTPALVLSNGERIQASPLRRLDLGGRDARRIDEAWLQQLIDEAPEVLPVTAVDSRVQGPLWSLGREVLTPSGPIDNLLLTQSGHIVVVETKLWRNPQARREAVAQILDYAKHLLDWTYEDVERLWRQRARGDASLFEAMTLQDTPSEADWVDRINNHLAAGEMVLLIVGDGIASRAESLAEAVGGHPAIQFRLALIELQLFAMADGAVLVVPHTLARTTEIQRATVRVVYDERARPEVAVEVPLPNKKGKAASGARVTLDAQAFVAELEAGGPQGAKAAAVANELLRQLEGYDELVVEWASSGFTIKTLDPVTEGKLLSVTLAQRPDTFYYSAPWMKDQIAKSWNDDDLAVQLSTRLSEIGQRYGARLSKGGWPGQSLTSLAGREADLVADLAELVGELRSAASELARARS